MRLLRGVISAVLALTLVGGAQLCAAVCAQPTKTIPVAAKTQKGCHNCHKDTKPEAPTAPAEPCQHCQKAPSDRVAAERDSGLSVTPLLAAILPPAAAEMVGASSHSPTATLPPATAPPNERLHVVCVLLI